MMLGTMWTRAVAMMFALAMMYASVCTNACAMGVCPTSMPHPAGHQCDQAPVDNSTGTHHHSQESPDCSTHSHASVFVEKAMDAPQVGTSSVNHISVSVSDLLVQLPLVAGTPSVAAAGSPGVSPPTILNTSLYQRVSPLRI
jgi:hypothetical protein